MAGVVSQLACVTAEQRHRKQPVEVVVIVKHNYTVPHPPDLAVRKDDAPNSRPPAPARGNQNGAGAEEEALQNVKRFVQAIKLD